ncbi:MAG: anti-sigma factor antagonist [Rhodococcus sp. (in: high G+C Gram-positive bacteria)]|nr:MAG: anti-sigma factor antagonist [Rhodococcus sp. (in: high G+C Gram-positive bacteria)]
MCHASQFTDAVRNDESFGDCHLGTLVVTRRHEVRVESSRCRRLPPGSTTTTEGVVAVVSPAGRLNIVAPPRLRELLRDSVDGGTTRVVADLSATDFIDSSGLGALISDLEAARKAWTRFPRTPRGPVGARPAGRAPAHRVRVRCRRNRGEHRRTHFR